MINALLASTSTLYGGQFLEYLKDEIALLFSGVKEIIFIPFARPGGITHDAYTQKVSAFFAQLNINVKGLHEFDNLEEAIANAKGFFTGGGNTFLLVKKLHELNAMQLIQDAVRNGTPYLGTSAGSNIGGINMCTTNDMPIVYPPSFECMGIVPFNINPHYLDPVPELKHNGETRETRIMEFLTQQNIPVVGLREGNYIRIKNGSIKIDGPLTTRIFRRGEEPQEVAPGFEWI